jgi:hypothetical protein
LEDFEELRTKNCYYVDKTLLIKDILDSSGTKATLITRPRRFGKTLALSMLKCFFEDTRDKSLNSARIKLFEGTKIAQEGKEYLSHMTSSPVISVSLKNIDRTNWSDAQESLRETISY